MLLFLQIILALLSLALTPPAGINIGTWRGVLMTKNGELPFTFETKLAGEKVILEINNGEEHILVDEVSISGDSVFIKMPVFDSEFRLKYTPQMMSGTYINYSRKADNIIPFKAEFNKHYRFTEENITPVANISGRWEVDFSKGTADSSKAVGVFNQQGNELTGTFLTVSGDYRYLEGTVQGDKLFLSTFDGAHAFLFTATIAADGIMSGMYYSGNHWKEPWIAKKNPEYQLPDPYSLTYLKPGYERFDFTFPDLSGKMVSLSDEQFKNKAVIVQIMGSWCPNCMDETGYFAPLYDQYKSRGLEIVALAYERSPELEKAKVTLERLKKRFNINYTILFAGAVGPDAAKTLPMINAILSYPTTIFIDKKGMVRKIYTGITGPATGIEYDKWKDDTNRLVDKLISE
ncbi:MAG: TlpA family protein disulfide reductase [Chitinophagales bacterium]|nr:TlpA family protein disulfide reductase [Chitinophagales bacterium]